MNKINEAILKTVVYADVFDYPLTSEELQRYLIKTPSRRQNDEEMLKLIQHDGEGEIETDGEYFFLKNRKEIVELRKKRERWSRGKLKMAEKAAKWLKFIPWIKMVGISGSLAMLNADKTDDIDMLIVSVGKRIWLTRFLATLLMEFLGKRRHPVARHPELVSGSVFKDKICLNMYLDEDHLQVPEKEQDLFTAHEVVQVKLLWDKDKIYNKFLMDNLWVKKYLPNALSFVIPAKAGIQAQRRHPELVSGSGFPIRSGMTGSKVFNFIENLVKNFQLWYMRSRRTTEVISDGVIRFHPRDARKWVLTRYQDSLKIALISCE